jgi:Leucine-rich repeat (LRR) protein
MNNIREIDLSENPIIGFSGLKFNPNLERLYLSGCKLKVLPKELIELKKLLVLDISFNKIQNYSEFSKISTLRELNLSSCDLKILPDDLKYLKNLKILLLDKNLGLNTNTVIEFLIKEIPELEELSIANCGVEKIPESIVSLSNLKSLNITGNMLSKEKIEQLKSLLPMCKIINSPPISSH